MATKQAQTNPAPDAAENMFALPDIGKLLESLKLPGIDVAAIVELQRADVQALADANREACEGIKALAERRNEILMESLAQWQQAMKQASDAQALSRQAEMAKQGVQQPIANVHELAEIEAAARSNAWKVLQDRFQENLANLQKLLQQK